MMLPQNEIQTINHYIGIFVDFNNNKWPYTKNRLDFQDIYLYDRSVSNSLDGLYECGRDISVFISNDLEQFISSLDVASKENCIKRLDDLVSNIKQYISRSKEAVRVAELNIQMNKITLMSISGMFSYHKEQNEYLNDLLTKLSNMKRDLYHS